MEMRICNNAGPTRAEAGLLIVHRRPYNTYCKHPLKAGHPPLTPRSRLSPTIAFAAHTHTCTLNADMQTACRTRR